MNVKVVPSRFDCVFAFWIIVSISIASGFSQSTVVQHNYPLLSISGSVGTTYPIQYVDTLSTANTWLTLTNLVLPASPYLLIDSTAPDVTKRFYRETNVTVIVRNCVGLTITGTIGSTNLIQSVEAAGNTNNWITLTNIVLPSSPFVFFDTLSPPTSRRLYRAEDLARPPRITSVDIVLAQIGVPFSYQITASSYLPVTNYDAVGLPSGLTVDPSSGLISGTPTQEITNTVTISARNSTGPGSLGLTLRLRRSLATEMASIPAGVFTMGSPASESGRDSNEGPQRTVVITHGFSMGKFEVSQAEYQAVLGLNPSFFAGDLARPVDFVSWQDATNFCALLTARDRASGYISATSFYRLPTEAEWEYAARAGSSASYSFGDDVDLLDQYGWYEANSGSSTHPVGQKLPNSWGLYDISGNAWEWCLDWFGPNPTTLSTDPQGPVSGTGRVVRGGSWFRPAAMCRAAQRLTVVPTARYTDLGFRIVLVTQ
jgi:formylglycine-generating enzyme required for sulfatase activity